MNYLKEMDAFRNWLLLNEMPASAIALWYTLMSINCSVSWKSRFNAPNSVVQKLTGLSKQGLSNGRKKLVENDLIIYDKGKKGQAPIYQMTSLVNSVDSSFVPLANQSMDESLTILRRREKEEEGRGGNAGDPFFLYENYIGMLNKFTEELLLAWRSKVGEDIMNAAIKLAARNGARTFGYVEKILEEWTAKELKTVEEVHAYQQAKTTRNNNTIPFWKKEREERKSLIDELREEIR